MARCAAIFSQDRRRIPGEANAQNPWDMVNYLVNNVVVASLNKVLPSATKA
jgi:hypothetical protein